ncbi:DUF4282 domain-containing protein [Collimonas fungivorans]|nr:DUF4282 domain-containing protein [Collimonas fungivorans]
MTNTHQRLAKLSYFFGFERLIAPVLIKLIYWIGIVVILIAGATSLVNTVDGIGRMLLTLAALLFSLLIWRLFSELLILAFNIYERLVEIRDLLAAKGTPAATIQPALREGD